MKKIILFLLTLFLLAGLNEANGQSKVKKRYNRPFFGLNFGATWQQSDVHAIAHGAGGFTFGKYYMQNETNLFDFGWRLRYLHGYTSGLDRSKNSNLKQNIALNGELDTTLNYYQNGSGYVYNNYKMTIDEGAFEIMLGLNKLREKTRVVAYLFGGAGISGWQTTINQLDSSGKRYNYTLIDNSGGISSTQNQLEKMYDKSYESNADGNSKYKVHFVPSIGIGLGWQTKRGHYIGLEHRMTFTLTDYADGVVQSGGGFFSGSNDLYHYTGFFIRWMIGSGHSGATTTNTTTTQHTTDPTGYTNNPPPPPPHYDPVVVNPPPPPPGNNKPSIIINYPTTNPFTTSTNMITVAAAVLNVGSRNDISVKVNGFPSPNFTYDNVSKSLSITSSLNAGNNNFYISAVNPYGSDWKSLNIIYDPGNASPPQNQKPLVTITSPAQNPFTTSQSNITVTGTVTNVGSRNDISVYVNNAPNGNFKYDVNSKVISLTTSLILGNNTISFNAANPYGYDSKIQTVNYQTTAPPPPSPKPMVAITNPNATPFTTNSPSQTVNAVIQNVQSQEEIKVSVNGIPSAFSYDLSTKNLSVTDNNLNTGNNIFTITASNQNGSDSKSTTVIYVNKKGEQAPQVILTSPNPNPYRTQNNNVTVTANVMYVNSQNEISVKINNQPYSGFSYNASNKQLVLSSNLMEGNNSFVITAANQNGNDSKTMTVIYQKKQDPKPIITINTPSSNPFTSSQNNVNVIATVLNVNSKDDIKVMINNSSFSNFTYSPDTKKVNFNTNLNSGSNAISITATNPAGSDSKTISVLFSKPVELPKPSVTITNPSSNPSSTENPNITITATILNVNDKNNIKITGPNNANITNFSFETRNNSLSFSYTLANGDNPFTITATNTQGSDSKPTVVKYTQKIIIAPNPIETGVGKKPVVTFTKPTTNPFLLGSNPNVNFAATVLNVNSKDAITITLNGVPVTNFSFDTNTKMVTFNLVLPLDINSTLTITGTNRFGSDSKTLQIKRI